MSSSRYDVVFIGGGPGGYAGAIKAAQLGLSVACVEGRGSLGGTCLNVGCIPSKALLESSHLFFENQNDAANHGLEFTGLTFDLKMMMVRKDRVVGELTKGIEYLFKKNKVDYIEGYAKIIDPNVVQVKLNSGGERTVEVGNIVIATGSEVLSLPGVEIDEKTIVSSTGALQLNEVPEHLVVIGGGYIGLELGSVWSRLGARVTVVEFLDRIAPGMDEELSSELQKVLTKQGMIFKLKTKVRSIEKSKRGLEVSIESSEGGDLDALEADVALVSIGRRPYTEGLGLSELGVEIDGKGFVLVNDDYQSKVAGVFAIGDVIPDRPMLAHKAEEEGIAIAEKLAGRCASVNYKAIPGVIYTWPEVATVGCSEEELQSMGVNYKVGKFPFSANSRARAIGNVEGFVKIIADAVSDRILGAHIIGPDAGTMISELVLALEYSASSEDLALTCHAHPTLNEAIKEAAAAVFGKAINI